jgi:transcriptional regulator with XRE-family HTH domain
MNEDYPCRTTGEPPLHTRLRRRRQELHLVQADVAVALNVSDGAVTLWESGRRRMELSKIPRLAEALQLDARELCIQALAEFHPVFHATLFGPRQGTPARIHPAA